MSIVLSPASIRYGAAALAATAALVAVGIFELATSGSQRTQVIQAEVPHPGSVQLRVAGGHGQLVLSHFPRPPAGYIYQVWYRYDGGAPGPTRTRFTVMSGGSAEVGLTNLQGVDSVWVTTEPRRGGFVPTSGTVFVVKIH